jgi:HlyD family secretion protein
MVTVRKSNNRVLWIAAVLLLVIVFYGVRLVTRIRLPIRVAEAVHAPLIKSLSTNGKVEPQVNFEAHALAPGPVKAVYVHEGDRVPKAKLLLAMNDTEARARLASAITALREAQASNDAVTHGGTQEERLSLQSDLTKAQTDRDQAQRDLAALEKLLPTGSASQSEVNAARLHLEQANKSVAVLQQRRVERYAPVDLEHAKAALAGAQAGYAAAQVAVEAANVRAPFAGTVYSLPVAATEFVQQGDRLLQLADLSKVQVRAYFDEPEIGSLQIGQPIEIQWAAKTGKAWHGHIVHVPSTIITYGTRNVGEVLVSVEDSDSTLLPSTNVTVTVTTKSIASAITVPREALHTEGGKDYVYLVLRETLHRTPVQVGAINLTQVQILSGVNEHDTVALGTTNGQPIVDGLPIKIVK